MNGRMNGRMNGVRALGLLALLPMLTLAGDDIPRAAQKYRAPLTRAARTAWGLDAPVPVFAAQIHQESGWNPAATSAVGASGMAQFMPATARWLCGKSADVAADCDTTNPVWALRALTRYDRILFDDLADVGGEFDRHWAALRAYNGGLSNWQQEARKAGSAERAAIDASCGCCRRARKHCAENLGYPQRILIAIQPRYSGWGRMVAEGQPEGQP